MVVKFNWLLVKFRKFNKKLIVYILLVVYLLKLCNIVRFLFLDFSMYLFIYGDFMFINEGVREL